MQNATNSDSLAILVFGDNASEKMGGEATKPIRFFRGYRARGHHCQMVTHERCRNEILKLFSEEEITQVTFLHDTRLQRWVHWLDTRLGLPVRPLIPLFSQLKLCRLIRGGTFGKLDVVHQTTPISPLAPSALRRIGCPVIHGPLAALPMYPPEFHPRGLREKLTSACRHLIAVFGNRLFCGRRESALVLCDNKNTVEVSCQTIGGHIPTEIVLNNAVENFWFDTEMFDPPVKPRFVFAGRLVEWKCVDLLIDAAGAFGGEVDLVIIGDGPLKEKLRAQALRYPNIAAEFLGWQDRQNIQDQYNRATGVVSLALQESGGTSVQEAMACGAPLIVSAWGGHTSRVLPGTGLLVEPGARTQMITEAASHMRTLYHNPTLARKLGAAARAHARDTMLWSQKIEFCEMKIRQVLKLS